MDRTQLSRSEPETVSPVIETCVSLWTGVIASDNYACAAVIPCHGLIALSDSFAIRAPPLEHRPGLATKFTMSILCGAISVLVLFIWATLCIAEGNQNLTGLVRHALRTKRTGDNQLYSFNNRTLCSVPRAMNW